MNTKTNSLTKKQNLSNTYVEIKNPNGNKQIDFIEEFCEKKCIGIYDENMYPLIISKENSYFKIIVVNLRDLSSYQENYILEYVNSDLIAIYNSKGKKIFAQKANQKLELISTPYCLFVNVCEENTPSFVYDVINKKILLTGAYLNSNFVIYENYFLETIENKIKAIHSYSGNLILKSDFGKLEITTSSPYSPYSYISYILEYFEDEKCHTIFENDKFSGCKVLYSDKDLDLAIQNISKSNFIIIGKVNNLTKAIFFYDVTKGIVSRSKSLDLKNDKYFVINNSDSLIQIMQNDRCVEILDFSFKSIVYVNSQDSCIPTTYLEIDTKYSLIKKIKAGNCISYYNYNGSELAKTTQKDINIITCKDIENTTHFLFMKDDKCIKIKSYEILEESQDVSYEIFKVYDDKLIGGYIIKNGKKIGIFDYNLKTIICVNENCSIEILRYSKGNTEKEDYKGLKYTTQCLKLVCLKYDKDGKCREIYNEKNKLLYATEDKECYIKPYNKYYLLVFKDDNCISALFVNYYKIDTIGYLSQDNKVFIPYKTKKGAILFKVYDSILKKNTSLVAIKVDLFEKLVDDRLGEYTQIYDLDEFLVVSNTTCNKLQLIIVNNLIYKCSITIDISSLYMSSSDGIFIINNEQPNFPYIYEKVSDKIVAIYLVTKKGFEKIFESKEGITPVYIDNNLFFKIGEKIFNRVGNLV